WAGPALFPLAPRAEAGAAAREISIWFRNRNPAPTVFREASCVILTPCLRSLAAVLRASVAGEILGSARVPPGAGSEDRALRRQHLMRRGALRVGDARRRRRGHGH